MPQLPFPRAARIRPIVHVHVSGSAGTTFCALARRQPLLKGQRSAGGAYNCIAPFKGQADWQQVSVSPDPKKTDRVLTLYASCDQMQETLSGYDVIAAFETFLPTPNESLQDSIRGATNFWRETAQLCPGALRRKIGCCACNQPPLRCMHLAPGMKPCRSGMRGHLAVERGSLSPLDKLWPKRQRFLTTYCSTLRYTFLMHRPARRLVSHRLRPCPVASYGANASLCVGWATDLLGYIYDKGLVLDPEDGQAAIGTPFVSNTNVRWLLGPRVFFARLKAVEQRHLAEAQELLSKFALVAPLAALADAAAFGRVLRSQLGWLVHEMPRQNVHDEVGRVHRALIENVLVGGAANQIALHNALDRALYRWVEVRYARDVQLSSR